VLFESAGSRCCEEEIIGWDRVLHESGGEGRKEKTADINPQGAIAFIASEWSEVLLPPA
jgi:hypothetical protein